MPLSDHVDYAPEEHDSRLLCGDPQACAFAWIEGYAKNLSSDRDEDDDYYGRVTADELIETGLTWIGTDWGDHISKGGLLEGRSVDPVFWDKLAVLKGIEIPQENRNSFFCCSC